MLQLQTVDKTLLVSTPEAFFLFSVQFVADNAATEVQTMPCDSTVSWMANKASADDAVEKHNANDLKDVKKCKECGEYFWQTDEERTWFADRNMKAPCRCYSCRKKKNKH